MKKRVLSTLLALAMVGTMLTACGGDSAQGSAPTADNKVEESTPAGTDKEASAGEVVEQGKVVNIYCWNTEFKERYDAYAADLADTHGVEVNFVIVANENNAYQNNLDAALLAQADAAADEKVDIFLIEADYASKYTKSEYALDVINEVGLTEDDLSGQYQYTKDIVSVDGVQKGITWQATPGLFA